MGLFGDENEAKRRQSLKEMEDKRLAFAEEMHSVGFAPEYMVAASTHQGGYVCICRDKGQICLIISPDFGGEGDFVLERYGRLEVSKEEYFEAPEGMAGVFGFGKKGQRGFYLVIAREDGELRVPFIANRNSAMEWGARNPLLSLKRRRGDANIVWDMRPVDKQYLRRIERALDEILA